MTGRGGVIGGVDASEIESDDEILRRFSDEFDVGISIVGGGARGGGGIGIEGVSTTGVSSATAYIGACTVGGTVSSTVDG